MGGFSKSVRAVAAERDGKLVASRLARLLGVRTSVLRRHLRPSEWHHTSSWLNRTKYYWEPLLIAIATGSSVPPLDHTPGEVERARALLAEMRRESAVDTAVVLDGQRVTWTEWNSKDRSGRRRSAFGCRVDVRGEWATITFGDGTTLRKRVGSRGLAWRPDDESDRTGPDIAALLRSRTGSDSMLVARFRKLRGRTVALRLERSSPHGYPLLLYREVNGHRAQRLYLADGPEALPHLERILDGWVLVDDDRAPQD